MIELLIEPDPTYGSLLVTVVGVVLVILSLSILAAAASGKDSDLRSVAISFAILSLPLGGLTLLVMTALVHDQEIYTAVEKQLPGEVVGGLNIESPPFIVQTSTGLEAWSITSDYKYLVRLEAE